MDNIQNRQTYTFQRFSDDGRFNMNPVRRIFIIASVFCKYIARTPAHAIISINLD